MIKGINNILFSCICSSTTSVANNTFSKESKEEENKQESKEPAIDQETTGSENKQVTKEPKNGQNEEPWRGPPGSFFRKSSDDLSKLAEQDHGKEAGEFVKGVFKNGDSVEMGPIGKEELAISEQNSENSHSL